jgi:aspartate racemase
MTHPVLPRHLAVIGGLGQLAGTDLYDKLARTPAVRGGGVRLTLERHRYQRRIGAVVEADPVGRRKLYLYDTAALLARSQADGLLLPCFISHTFLAELQAEVQVPVFDMMTALAEHIGTRGPVLGVLCTRYVREQGLFERYFDADRLRHSSPDVYVRAVEPSIYGDDGVLAGHTGVAVLDRLQHACEDLLAQGADIIVPGSSEIAVMAEALRLRGLPVVDSHQVYADYALAQRETARPDVFRVGIIGGIGPAATVDFMQKIIRNTRAERDQDHIRLVVDHNPEIPDRTAYLVGKGTDPTLGLYSACKRLQANGAALIAMPCNTAHAYVARLQPGLAIPIVNMLTETVRHIRAHCPGHARVGLLATSGTIATGVYHDAARDAGFELVVPDARHQELVMDTIYGRHGVKAGFVAGPCREALLEALAHLVARGATAVILGCTELPLVLPEHPAYPVGNRTVVLLDPTMILARRCVELADVARFNVRRATSPASRA